MHRAFERLDDRFETHTALIHAAFGVSLARAGESYMRNTSTSDVYNYECVDSLVYYCINDRCNKILF